MEGTYLQVLPFNKIPKIKKVHHLEERSPLWVFLDFWARPRAIILQNGRYLVFSTFHLVKFLKFKIHHVGMEPLLGLPGFLGPASGCNPWLGPSIQEDTQRSSSP
jgi:hypothetical protein